MLTFTALLYNIILLVSCAIATPHIDILKRDDSHVVYLPAIASSIAAQNSYAAAQISAAAVAVEYGTTKVEYPAADTPEKMSSFLDEQEFYRTAIRIPESIATMIPSTSASTFVTSTTASTTT